MNDTLFSTLSLLFGLLIRFGIPLLITALLVWGLNKLDAHWQAEAAQQQAKQPAPIPCWQRRGCSMSQRLNCPVYANPSRPCWEQRSGPAGQTAICQQCPVWQQQHQSLPLIAA